MRPIYDILRNQGSAVVMAQTTSQYWQDLLSFVVNNVK